jgi:hypothetical protein
VEDRYDEALDHLDKALSVVTVDEMPPLQARIQFEIAATLGARGKQSDEYRAAKLLLEV